ncbi:hypothetical protein JTE90_027311 [Oedothorax gibbosus]|uniref:Uncharacterized protein n=1 Tax=Oedothorax gibbosus TaxID=931172 RepID=A0AAV6W0I8_9ARAC|nr:hypothetical protein JTE90_027311 [Oedothorax gibbosus]
MLTSAVGINTLDTQCTAMDSDDHQFLINANWKAQRTGKDCVDSWFSGYLTITRRMMMGPGIVMESTIAVADVPKDPNEIVARAALLFLALIYCLCAHLESFMLNLICVALMGLCVINVHCDQLGGLITLH